MANIKILIVEDEVIIAEDIAIRLSDMGFIISQSIDNVDSAVEWLNENSTDLVLIDIALQGDKTGIDLAKIINNQFHLPFIFLTSLSDNAIVEKAKATNPSAYLLKPFNDNQVRISVEMAFSNFYHSKGKVETSEALLENDELTLKMTDALFLKKDAQYKKENFCDILWLEAESNYTTIKTKTGKYIYSTVLKNFEDKLPRDTFARVHRSYIVNLNCVSGLYGNMLIIEGKHIPVNRSSQESVFKRFRIM